MSAPTNARSNDDLAQGCGDDLDRRPRVGALDRVVRDVDRPGGAHRQRLAERLRRPAGANGQDGYFAAVRLSQLERLLEQVLVIAVRFELHGPIGQQVAAEPFRADDWHSLEQNDNVQTTASLTRRRLAKRGKRGRCWDRPRFAPMREASQR